MARQPADIAVGFELAPGETLLGDFVDRHVLAHQRLGLERSVGGGLAPDRRLCVDDLVPLALVALALDKPRRLDPSLQMPGGEVGPRRGQPRIELRHRDSPLAVRVRRSPNCSTASAPLTVRWITTLRRSASSRRRATRPRLPMVSSARVMTGLVTLSFLASPRTLCGGGSR